MNGVPSVLIPVFPVYGLSLGANPFELGLMGGVTAIVYTVSTLSLGTVWAKVGRRLPIVSSSILFGFVYFLYSLTSSPLQIILLKFLEGFALSLFWPPIEALLVANSGFSKETTSRFCLSFSGGAALGSFLSTFALTRGELRNLFVIVASLYLFSAFISLYFIRDRAKPTREDEKESGRARISGEMFKKLKVIWASVAISSSSIGIVFSLFPAYADIQKIEVAIIGLSVFLITFGRATAFLVFGRIRGGNVGLIRVSAALIAIGVLPLALTKGTALLLSGSFILGFGSGLLYSHCFQRVMTIDPKKNDIYAGIFEGTVGVGFMTSIIAGALAEKALNAPYIMVSIIAASLFAIASVKRQ